MSIVVRSAAAVPRIALPRLLDSGGGDAEALAASAISCDLRLKERCAPERGSTAGLPAAKGGPQIDRQATIRGRNTRPFA
jgi:hypothetical protein